MTPISQLIFDIDDALNALNIKHAFGGALALAYYAEPRGTIDIDFNVETPYDLRDRLLNELAHTGWQASEGTTENPPAAGIRLRNPDERVVMDVFFTFDAYHDDVLANSVRKPFVFGTRRSDLPFLAANDLAVFKISFARPKDWVDLRAMLEAGTPLDVDYVERQLLRFRGPSAYPAVARFRALVSASSQ
jgi:hypothetical protein